MNTSNERRGKLDDFIGVIVILIVIGIIILTIFLISAGVNAKAEAKAEEFKDESQRKIVTGGCASYPYIMKWNYLMIEEVKKLISSRSITNAEKLLKHPVKIPPESDSDKAEYKANVIWATAYIKFLKEIEVLTIKVTDQYAIEKDMSDYDIVEITRSSNKNMATGTYIFKFDSEDNLLLLRAPCIKRDIGDDCCSLVYDKKLEVGDIIRIDKNLIKDFQIFGSQLMKSTISSENTNTGNTPVVRTMISEMVFGTSYTLLKGMNGFSVGTEHKIEDARKIQLIFTDKTDIEFHGISIFYEFNKRMGNVKNKEILKKLNNTGNEDDQISKNLPPKIELAETPQYLIEIKELSKLFKEGILDENEYKTKKHEILFQENDKK